MAVWLLLWGGLISPVFAYTQVAPPPAWQTTPVMSEDIRPTYQFRSTSSYMTTTGCGSVAPVGATYSSRPRRSNPWDDSGDPSGSGVGNVDTPIGSPLVLLVLAMLYILKKNIVLISKSTNFKKILKK